MAFAVFQLASGKGRAARWAGAGCSLVAGAAVLARYPAVSAVAVALTASAQTQTAAWLAWRLSLRLSGIARRRRLLAMGWADLGLLLLVQTGRLSAYMADPSVDWCDGGGRRHGRSGARRRFR
jgi:hypothetical protein